MPDKKLRYECPACGREFKKNELINGQLLPLHTFNKAHCEQSGQIATIRRK